MTGTSAHNVSLSSEAVANDKNVKAAGANTYNHFQFPHTTNSQVKYLSKASHILWEKKDTLIAILGRNCFIHLSDSDLVISGYFLH